MRSSSEAVTPLKPPEPEGHGEAEEFDPGEHRPTPQRLRRVGVAAGVVLVVLLLVGIVPRVLHQKAMDADESAAAAQGATVRVARAERSPALGKLTLPGSVQPLQETAIYARASGYVRRWSVDIGAEVKKGQVLMELDLPDVDEQLRQARAAAAQAKAGIAQAQTQMELARTTSVRYAKLRPAGVASQQEVDQYEASYNAQKANLEAAQAAYGSAEANVRRYEDLRSFGTVVAPFDGVVTQRTAEVGQLVTSGTGTGQPLYKVAEVDVVRVFLNVPQLYAADIQVGLNAPVTVREMPGRVFQGTVARTSKELDTATRSLLTEVDIPNPDRVLVSGMYAQVALDVQRKQPPLLVPATAVLFDAEGTRVAAVDHGVVHWKPVEIGADMGNQLAIASGLAEGEAVAVTPSERLHEGMRVEEREAGGEPKVRQGRVAEASGR